MAYAVTHILIPVILVALFRDFIYFAKHNKKFSMHYVLLAGFGGILPDIDIAFYFILHYFGFAYESVHRSLTHSFLLPLILLLAYFVFKNNKGHISLLGKHKLKLSYIFLVLAFGSFTHIVLDVTLKGSVLILSPFSIQQFGFNFIDYLPQSFNWMALPILDGVLLIVWLTYLELKHKISDFI